MHQISRRSFLKTSGAAAAALSLPASFWARAAGANDTIRAAVIGFNGRGKSHIDSLRKIPGVKIVALCDIDDKVLARGVAELKKKGDDVTGYKDVRKLLENKDIDVVATATPNHWHSLVTVWACQAGKDVYVEKPVSHNVWEGAQAVKAAAKYNRIVQAGMQCRSSPGIRAGIEFLHKGGLGKIIVSRGLCYKRRDSLGKAEGPVAIPPEVGDLGFDLWCGPAPKVAPTRKKFHYDWHWFWATGNGDIGNQGIHQMDLCRWALGVDELSPRVMAIGGRFGYEDDGETPNTMIAFHDYAGAPLIFEVRGLPEKSGAKSMDKFLGAGVGCVIHCENGYMVIPSYSEATAYDKDGKKLQEFKAPKAKKTKDTGASAASGVVMDFAEDGNHFGNFIRAVRSRKMSDLNGPIHEGHLSSALCHTPNISYRLGQRAPTGAILEQIKGCRDMSATFDRFKAHLAANGINLDETKAVLGSMLTMDAKAEKFVDNDAANALAKEKQRAPFAVPDEV